MNIAEKLESIDCRRDDMARRVINAAPDTQASPAFLPAGLGLCAVLFLGRGAWQGVLAGALLKNIYLLLLGSDTVGEEALIRFYLLHVMILPLLLASACVDLRISQIVDRPNWLVSLYFPRRVFG